MTDASVIFKTDYGGNFESEHVRQYGGKIKNFTVKWWDDTHSSPGGKMTDASVIFKTDYGGNFESEHVRQYGGKIKKFSVKSEKWWDDRYTQQSRGENDRCVCYLQN